MVGGRRDQANAGGGMTHPGDLPVDLVPGQLAALPGEPSDELPPGFDDYETLVRWFSETLTVDGLFTDFTDLTLRALGRQTGPE